MAVEGQGRLYARRVSKRLTRAGGTAAAALPFSATAILPYSLRARAGAPVAWDEVPGLESAAAFTIADAAALRARAESRALRGWGAADQALPLLG